MVGRQQEKIREGSNLNNTTTCCTCQKHLTVEDKEKHVALMLANTETLAMFITGQCLAYCEHSNIEGRQA